MIEKSEIQRLEKSLTHLGLVSKEASVYLALLQLGVTGSSRIMGTTSLHGQFVYQALASLEEKGLVQHVIQNGRKKFSAKPPSVLVSLIEQQKREAESVATSLERVLTLSTPQQFEVFQGQESFVVHESDLLRHAPKDATILVLGGSGDAFVATMADKLI